MEREQVVFLCKVSAYALIIVGVSNAICSVYVIVILGLISFLAIMTGFATAIKYIKKVTDPRY